MSHSEVCLVAVYKMTEASHFISPLPVFVYKFSWPAAPNHWLLADVMPAGLLDVSWNNIPVSSPTRGNTTLPVEL